MGCGGLGLAGLQGDLGGGSGALVGVGGLVSLASELLIEGWDLDTSI